MFHTHTHTQTLSFSYDAAATESTLERLRTGLNADSADSDTIASASVLLALNQGLGAVFAQIQAQATPINFGDLDSVFISLDVFEIARWLQYFR